MATMQPDLDQQTKEIYAALSAHDVEKFLSYHTDDVIVENVAAGVVSRGKGEEIRAGIHRILATIPDLKMELISVFASGNLQCEEFVMSGTPTAELSPGIPATGKSFSVRGMLKRELRNGKTCRVTQYTDYASILQQLGVLPSPQESVSQQRINDAIAAVNAHDVEKILSLSADDVFGENVALGIGNHGKEQSRRYFNQLFAAIPDFKIEPTLFFASGNHQCMEYVASGTPVGELPGGMRATGKSFALRCVGVSELRDGKTCRASTYSDSATMLRQLGVLPPMPQK